MGVDGALSRGRVLLSAVLLLSAVGCLVYSQQVPFPGTSTPATAPPRLRLRKTTASGSHPLPVWRA